MTDYKNEDELLCEAEQCAMENDIYYAWLQGQVSQNDYDEFIEGCVEKLREKYNKEEKK